MADKSIIYIYIYYLVYGDTTIKKFIRRNPVKKKKEKGKRIKQYLFIEHQRINLVAEYKYLKTSEL